jgi:hypothetical protein
MATATDLKFFLSGGAGNTNPNLSLGGVISATQLVKQTATKLTNNITGVTVSGGSNNTEGTGTLRFDVDGASRKLFWTPPGGLEGPGHFCIPSLTTADVPDSTLTRFLSCGVAFASLPATDQSDTVSIVLNTNNLFDAVSASESQIGRVEYRAIFLKNTHPTDDIAIIPYIPFRSTGPEAIALAWENTSGTGAGQTIANETTVPTGVTFSTPLVYTSGPTIQLPATKTEILWLRRTIRPLTVDSAPKAWWGLAVRIYA